VRLRDEKSNNKKIKVMKARFLEKFIMMEFVKGNLDSQEQVNDMVSLIQRKLGVSVENAGEFLRKAVGLI
jgi:hypothetical protein